MQVLAPSAIRAACGAALSLLTALLTSAQAAPPPPLDANTATQAQLEQLRGVGVAMSEALLAEREKRPFSDWNDLIKRVPGLGRKSAARLCEAGLRVGSQGCEALGR